MGRGSRHSQSNQYKPYFTYDERNSRVASYRGLGTTRLALDVETGTLKVRVGADSQKPFDACWLCSQTAATPVVTPQGMLYCRECVVEYMVQTKKDIKKKLAEYEKQQEGKSALEDSKAAACDALRDAAAKSIEESILPTSGVDLARKTEAQAQAVADAAASEGIKKTTTANAFWSLQNAPEYKATEVKKPDEVIRDPFNKKPLKLKQLRDVRWTRGRKEVAADAGAAADDEGPILCPVSNVTIGNGTAITILPSGHAVAKRELERIWGKKLKKAEKKEKKEKKEGKDKGGEGSLRCPLTDNLIDRADLLDLVDAGTAFAASTAESDVGKLEVEKYRMSMTIT